MSPRNHRCSFVRSPLLARVSRPLSLALSLALAAPGTTVLAAAGHTAQGATQGAADHAMAIEPEGDPEALSSAAVERFEAKDYDGAVELFEQAYAIDPQPNYLFNIGRVYEEKGDLENAVTFYQRFVSQPGVDIESRQAATERLKVLREALAQLEANGEPKDETTDEPKDETTEPKDETTGPTTTPPDDDPEAAKRKKTLRITGYSLMGAGGAALIVGAVFGGLASSSVKEGRSDRYVEREEAFIRRATRQARVADAMFITGGVLAAAGLTLVLVTLGGKKKGVEAGDTARRRTQWSPVVGPQQVGMALEHRF